MADLSPRSETRPDAPLDLDAVRALAASACAASCPHCVEAGALTAQGAGGDATAEDCPHGKVSKHPELQDVLARNRAWSERMRSDDPQFFERTRNTQSPDILYIGCADSRVPANQILDLKTNQVFVARNIANQVNGIDLNVQSVLSYAVEVLDVRHIIVCGHYDCGGVRAAVRPAGPGTIGVTENWLRSIRDVYRLHANELDMINDEEQRHRRLVELNVVEQVMNIFKTGLVQKRRAQTINDPDYPFASPRVHAMVFDPADGILHRLDVNMQSLTQQFHHIYDLYDTPAPATQPRSKL